MKTTKTDNKDSRLMVINFLTNVAEQYPEYRIRYEHDTTTNDHIIEIDPFNQESELFDKLIEFQEEFINMFPYQSLIFVTTNDIIKITHPVFDSNVYHFTNEFLPILLDVLGNSLIDKKIINTHISRLSEIEKIPSYLNLNLLETQHDEKLYEQVIPDAV